ncbi:MAG: hypothetical protein GH155_07770 [Spirochaeta sp.]|nr:hypothetical protein [Spirochaeta sp.]
MKNNINMGVLGLGRMGQVHCRQIAATPGLFLSAASSRSPEIAAGMKEELKISVYDSHERLLEENSIDWTVITTFTHEHKKWALRAIAAGKNLIIEKPVALSYQEAAAIFQAAREKGVKVTVHLNRRWDRDFELVQRVLKEDLLGEVYRIESRYTNFSSGWAGWGLQGLDNPWRLKKAYGGGLLSDWGPHLFDQLLLLTASPPKCLFGKTENRIWSSEVEDHFWAEVLFRNGVSARVEASNNHRYSLPRWLLLGSKGTLKMSGGDPSEWNIALIRKNFHDFQEETTLDTSQQELSGGFYPAFAAALQQGKEPPVGAEEVLAAARLMDAVKESDSRGQSIDLSVD